MKTNCILDSGAYSAWRSGKPIDLEKYCDWLEKNMNWIGPYVALDVIGPNDSEVAAEASYKNLLRMHQRGLKPIPVWHAGEDVKWLYKMLDLGCDYIGLSASSLVTKHNVDDWYAYAWSHLVTSEGLPIIKAHAFGEGRLASLKRFPWYSADSTSWIYSAQRNGNVQVDRAGRRIAMRNDGLSVSAAPDINVLADSDKEALERICSELKINPAIFKDLSTADKATTRKATIVRSLISGIYFLGIQTDIRAVQPIRFFPNGFFHGSNSKAKPVDVGPFRMHLVMGNNAAAHGVIAWLKHEHMLTSYFYIEGGGIITTEDYLKPFVVDPIAACQSINKLNNVWKILEEYTYA